MAGATAYKSVVNLTELVLRNQVFAFLFLSFNSVFPMNLLQSPGIGALGLFLFHWSVSSRTDNAVIITVDLQCFLVFV